MAMAKMKRATTDLRKELEWEKATPQVLKTSRTKSWTRNSCLEPKTTSKMTRTVTMRAETRRKRLTRRKDWRWNRSSRVRCTTFLTKKRIRMKTRTKEATRRRSSTERWANLATTRMLLTKNYGTATAAMKKIKTRTRNTRKMPQSKAVTTANKLRRKVRRNRKAKRKTKMITTNLPRTKTLRSRRKRMRMMTARSTMQMRSMRKTLASIRWNFLMRSI
mmetsp:Transcript_25139/g.60467  ORF Transcript_25139/g.60467 Transcript_25139/m.60467 type:complete len:219 (-) Transcript_25139:373-1029(-)